VRHSLSPVLHNAAYRALGLDWVYVAFEVAPGAARHALTSLLLGTLASGILALSFLALSALSGATHVLEIGFHAEHPAEPDNQAALTHLLTTEPTWRADLGDDPRTGAFLGRTTWRRISETWPDADLTGPDIPFEIGVRLVDYIRALEPHRKRV